VGFSPSSFPHFGFSREEKKKMARKVDMALEQQIVFLSAEFSAVPSSFYYFCRGGKDNAILCRIHAIAFPKIPIYQQCPESAFSIY